MSLPTMYPKWIAALAFVIYVGVHTVDMAVSMWFKRHRAW